MFSKASDQREETVARSVNAIQAKINEETRSGNNKIRVNSSIYYMGPEVTDALKEAGYSVREIKQQNTVETRYEITW